MSPLQRSPGVADAPDIQVNTTVAPQQMSHAHSVATRHLRISPFDPAPSPILGTI